MPPHAGQWVGLLDFFLADGMSYSWLGSLRLRMLEDMQIRNLAVNTQESYVQQISLFARYFNRSPERLGPEQIRAHRCT
jgi:Phage integrase, N-terminal SAM-like domain